MCKEENCYLDGVRYKHLLDYDPYCPLHPKTYHSEPSPTAISDSTVCGDYEAEEMP